MGCVIFYICNGKNPKCSKKAGCGPDYCYRTIDERYAKYGKCEGDPSWFPERFYLYEKKNDQDIWIEKEKI